MAFVLSFIPLSSLSQSRALSLSFSVSLRVAPHQRAPGTHRGFTGPAPRGALGFAACALKLTRAHLRRLQRCQLRQQFLRPRSSATAPPLSVLGRCAQETHLPYLKVPTSGGSRLKMPFLGLLSRLVSAPPQKPRLAQNEAHTAPQQRYSFLIGSTWPL